MLWMSRLVDRFRICAEFDDGFILVLAWRCGVSACEFVFLFFFFLFEFS